jgi:tetratricopeptide (TPR) repeat protein
MERISLVQPLEWVMVRFSQPWYAIVWGCLLFWFNLLTLGPSLAQEAPHIDQEFARGLAAYAQCNFTKARDHFRNVVAQTPDDAQALFYLGVILGHLHAFDEAVTRLQQTLALSPSEPSIPQVHYHLGWIYTQMQGHEREAQDHFAQAQGEFDPRLTHYYQGTILYKLDCIEQAKPFLKAVLQEDPGSYEAHVAQRYYYDIIQRQREQRWWQLQGTLGFQYDDNVVLEPNNNAFAFGRQGDARTVFTAVGRLLATQAAPWRFGAGYALFQSLHSNLTEFDLQSHTGGLFASVDLSRVTLRVDADYTFTLLDNARLSETVTVQPALSLQQTKALYAVLSVQYRRDNFFNQFIPAGQETVRDRDGWAVQAGFDQYLRLNRQGTALRLSYHYEVSRNEGSDWEYNGHYVALGLRTPLWWDMSLDAGVGYTRRDFLHINSFDASPLAELTPADRRARDDDRVVGSIILNRPVGPYLILSAGYTHISNISNLDFFDYRRNIMTLALTGRF